MRSSRSGFSLVEVVIAMAVLAIAFFGMISVITYSSRTNALTRERMIAMRAAEKKIEQMLNTGGWNELDNFRTQSEGLGWEQVLEFTKDGVMKQALLPAVRPPSCVLATGYTYPAPDPKAVLFVRFPLNSAGTSITQTLSGQFANNYTLGNPLDPNSKIYADLDLDAVPTTTGDLLITACKILPVIIDVWWKGADGKFNSLQYRYTFYNPNPTGGP
jgi:type II secretion system protein I